MFAELWDLIATMVQFGLMGSHLYCEVSNEKDSHYKFMTVDAEARHLPRLKTKKIKLRSPAHDGQA